MFIKIAPNDNLVSFSQLRLDLTMPIFIEGQTRILVIIPKLKVGPVLAPDQRRTKLVWCRVAEAYTPEMNSILAQKLGPRPATKA